MNYGESFKKVQNPKYFKLPAWCVSPRGSSFRSLLSLGVPQPTKGRKRQSKHITTALDSDNKYGSRVLLGEFKAFRNGKVCNILYIYDEYWWSNFQINQSTLKNTAILTTHWWKID